MARIRHFFGDLFSTAVKYISKKHCLSAAMDIDVGDALRLQSHVMDRCMQVTVADLLRAKLGIGAHASWISSIVKTVYLSCERVFGG